MKISATVFIWLILTTWQGADIMELIEKFGFPTALCLCLFFYFTRAINRSDVYRAQTIRILEEQLRIAQDAIGTVRHTNVILEKQTHAIKEGANKISHSQEIAEAENYSGGN